MSNNSSVTREWSGRVRYWVRQAGIILKMRNSGNMERVSLKKPKKDPK